MSDSNDLGEIKLPIIQRNYPNSIRNEIMIERPTVPKPTERRLKFATIFGFYITGGHYHDFMNGFRFDPYGLEFRVGLSMYYAQRNGFYALIPVKHPFFRSKTLLLPESWKKIVGNYIELRRKAGFGKNLIKGRLKWK